MSLAPAGFVILAIAVAGASLALAAFFWALRTRQFSAKHLNQGADVIFDSAEPAGKPADQLFKMTHPNTNEPIDDGPKGRD
jgi:cbb3-type cytochrome oxidase maturation protein